METVKSVVDHGNTKKVWWIMETLKVGWIMNTLKRVADHGHTKRCGGS